MKENIYTIPINDAFSLNTECPVCEFIRKEEADRVEYALGASMMEPDARVLSNEKGYCQKHTSMMYAYGNKLSHALVLETRLKHLSKTIDAFKSGIKPPKKAVFGKDKLKDDLLAKCEKVLNTSHSCVICDRLEYVLEGFMDNLFHIYKKDDDFKKKFFSSNGFCIQHFELLLNYGIKHLSDDELYRFVTKLCELEKANIDRVADDVEWFTKKFDYRFKDEDWKNSKDAVPRGCMKISGYINSNTNE